MMNSRIPKAKVKMLIVWIMLLKAAFPIVQADLVVKPRDTEAVIGDSIYFDCASDVNTNEVLWYHYAVGAKDHEDVCIYCLGKIHPRFENRIKVERNVNNGNSRLKFKSLQQQDAGRYVCHDNGGIGESSSAQLVILESRPICSSNIKSDGVLGPNDCGLEPDKLRLSCHVSYHGNIPPDIKWRQSDKQDPASPLSCQDDGRRKSCILTMTADLDLNGASYICESNRSTTTPNYCASDVIRITYVKINNSTKEMIESADEEEYCSVTGSLSCDQTWKWFDGVHEEVVSHGSTFVAHKPGWYKCEAQCNIRGTRCIVLSKLVHVSDRKGLSVQWTIAASCLATVAMELVIFSLVYYMYSSCKNARPSQRLNGSQEKPLLEDQNIPIDGNQQPGSILTTEERGRLIRGMTTLNNELYVVFQRCSSVEIFDCDTLNSTRQFTLKELIRPSDISSCKENKCLYIMDWKEDVSRKEVLCVDPNGTVSHHWETGSDYGNLVSVTNEHTIIILTCYGKNEFSEFSPDGECLRKIVLQDVEIPTHVVKLPNGDFVVSNGDASHLLHRVCIVDSDGRVKHSFGREKGSDFKHLDHPLHLAVFVDGSVAVLDNGNRRMLLLDKDLQFNRVLFSKNGLQNPIRLLLDDSNDRLFVADSHDGTGTILVFHLATIQKNLNKDATI